MRPVEFRQTLAAAFLLLSVAGGAIVVTAEGIGPLDADVVLPLLVCMLAGYALGAVVFICVYIFLFSTRKRGSFFS